MELQQKLCPKCGPKEPKTGATNLADEACPSCKTALVLKQRCGWCVQWFSAQDYCEHCGSVVTPLGDFGIARLLKRKGINSATLSIEINKLSPTEKETYKAEFAEHSSIADALIGHARLCSQYLFDPTYLARFENDLIKELPFEQKRLEYYRQGVALPEVLGSVRLSTIAFHCKIEALAELATVALVRHPDAIIDSENVRLWFGKVSALALGGTADAVEALIALAHWRTWSAPFFMATYSGDVGRKLYNAGFAKLHNSEGLMATWLAALCAKTEYFAKLDSGDKNKRKILQILSDGLKVNDIDLRMSCALLLNDEFTLFSSLQNERPDLRRFALLNLARLGSAKLAPLLDALSLTDLSQVIDAYTQLNDKSVPRPIIAALAKLMETADSSLLEQILLLVAAYPEVAGQELQAISKTLAKCNDPKLAIMMLSAGDFKNSNELQKLLVRLPFDAKWLPKLEALAKTNYLIPALAELLAQFVRRQIVNDAMEEYTSVLQKIVTPQLQAENAAAFTFRRLIVESFFGGNAVAANAIYEILKDDLDTLAVALSDEALGIELYNTEFCETYLGSVDNFLSGLGHIIKNPSRFKNYSWVLKTLLQAEHNVRSLLLDNLTYARLLLPAIIDSYLSAPDLKTSVAHFICAPVGEAPSPFFEVIELEDFDQGLLPLLADVSSQYTFSKRLSVEALQYLEIATQAEYIEQIKLVLTHQSRRVPEFAYYCISFIIRNCFNIAKPELANKAFSILGHLSSENIVYLSPSDGVLCKINDLCSLIKNYFNSLEDFSGLMLNIVKSPQVFGIEIWLLKNFQRNCNLVNSQFSSQAVKLHQVIIAVTNALMSQKYVKSSQSLAVEFLNDFIPKLPINEVIQRETLKVLSGIKVGAPIDASVASQLRMLNKELERYNLVRSEELDRLEEQTQKKTGFLENINFSGINSDLEFDVSILWLTRFVQSAKSLEISKLMPTLALLHNRSREFNALLENEQKLKTTVLDTLIGLLSTESDTDDQYLAQKLLASEIIFLLAHHSVFAHYCIARIKKIFGRELSSTGVSFYIRRIIDNLSETRLIKKPGASSDNAIVFDADLEQAVPLPTMGMSELRFDATELAGAVQNEQARVFVSEAINMADCSEYIEAIDRLKSALEVEASDYILYLIAKAYLLYDLPDRAEKYLQKCLVKNPNNWQALLLYAYSQEYVTRDYGFAHDLSKRAYALKPDSDRVLTRLGSVNIKLGNYNVAMKLIQEALRANPDNSEIYYLLGEILQKNKRYREATQNYKKAISMGCYDPVVFSALGICEYSYGEVTDAVKYLKQALKLDANCGIAHFGLGQIYLASGDYPKAESHLTQAYHCEQCNSQYQVQLAELYQTLGQPQKALDIMFDAVNSANPDPSHLIRLARLCRDNNRHFDAQDYLEKAITKQPENYTLYFELAELYEVTEALGNSVGILRRAVDIKPDFTQAWVKMADIYSRLGRADEAQESYKMALDIDENQADALLGMGTLLRNAGKTKAAKRFLDKAQALQDRI